MNLKKYYNLYNFQFFLNIIKLKFQLYYIYHYKDCKIVILFIF